MSCLHIGLGMNSVVRTTIRLMDQGMISKEAARIIIRSCARGVYWCDGNPGEATEYIRRCICGRCMKRVPAGEKLYSVYSASCVVPGKKHPDDNLAVDVLCEECFDIVINDYCKDSGAGERERKQIEERLRPEDYTSSGEYEDTNNGFRWHD